MTMPQTTPLLGNTERRIAAVALCAALGAGGIAFRSWLDARDDRMRMSATLSSQGSIIAAAEKREQDRAQQLADTLRQIADLKRTVQTPQQVLREIPQYLPQLPQPLETAAPARPASGASASGKAATPANVAGKLPGNPAGNVGEVAAPGIPDVRVPSADFKPLFDYVQDCRACQAKLTAAQQDLVDEHAKSAALTRERDAAVKAAKGGSVWTRTLRAVKWVGVGFVAGYVVRTAAR
jgi:hypothetical protein